MKSFALNLKGSAFCVDPLEQHLFEEGPDDYYCKDCHKPRALHLHTGFTPSTLPHTVSWDPTAAYRGGHPHFRRQRYRTDETGLASSSAIESAHRQQAWDARFMEDLLQRISPKLSVSS